MRFFLVFLLCVVGWSEARVVRKTQAAFNAKSSDHKNDQQSLSVGIGKADVTGPVAEINFMGYAMPQQTGRGLHIRLYARAFLFIDGTGKRAVYVSVDNGMVMTSVKLGVIEALKSKFGNMYDETNVLIHGTHTHSGPGGFSWYLLYEITSLGFCKENYDAVVSGIVRAIVIAHNTVKPATLTHGTSKLAEASINRSLYAYLFNPIEERQKYGNDSTDHTFELLRIQDSTSGMPMGLMYFFAVHGTSMNNTNKLVSGDNRGYASQVLEKAFAAQNPGFIAASGQANEGDVSPNTVGALCPDMVTPCRFNDSTCLDPHTKQWRSELCRGVGPGENMFQAARIIGEKQAAAAISLWPNAQTVVTGPVDYRHSYVHMANVTIEGTGNTTCPPAMGYSFAAGTTDGPGDFNFQQGTNTTNPFWNAIVRTLKPPSPAQRACQAPKPILLDVGEIDPPWAPTTLPLQILRLGNLFIVAPPSEFTTMSGRRLRAQLIAQANQAGIANPIILIAGLSNAYSGYTTTFEEYQAQRYEGASTMYGPHQLAAYMQEFGKLMNGLLTNTPVEPGSLDKKPNELSFIPPVVVDGHPIGKPFGTVLTQPNAKYLTGDTVVVDFVSSNPRNNLYTDATFLEVQQTKDNGNIWTTVFTDADWSTKFLWERVGIDGSKCTVEWEIPADMVGTFRIIHYNSAKTDPFSGKLRHFVGVSAGFDVYDASSAGAIGVVDTNARIGDRDDDDSDDDDSDDGKDGKTHNGDKNGKSKSDSDAANAGVRQPHTLTIQIIAVLGFCASLAAVMAIYTVVKRWVVVRPTDADSQPFEPLSPNEPASSA